MATHSENSKPILAQVLALFASIFAVVGIGDGFYLLWQNQTANSSLAFTVGILLLLLSQFDRFESVKGFGIEAKVSQLDNKIREADQINATLKNLTASLAQLAFEMMSRIGRIRGPIGRKESLEIEESLLQQMRDADIADVDIARAVLPVRQIVAFDILRPAINEVDSALTTWETAARQRFGAVRQPIDMTDLEYIGAQAELDRLRTMRERLQKIRALDYGTKQSEDLRQLAADIKANAEAADFTPTQDFYEALDDHAYYVRNGKHRNVERWVAGELE
ncbi:hypothetical protein [Burkholderia multivorans]|uniref:hypothetical protein n=1 Tax=Burkholderia multivorans TaxID=87883 RepID=UPI001B9EAA6F|nr:hypothetical protein [Burkholderia multivorans]MBR8122228.1 hypothetical protein [Burkholderia multivorans]MBU9599942.1 hypothetical protein [Burkholderia multivorans]